MRLPNKTYLVQNERKCLLNLVDIIYAYAYDHRITVGEHNVESPWTIATLSPTLAWFESFAYVKDAVLACFRRTLCYPLYRHFNLAKQILKDTITIFRLGKRSILKCLLQIKKILDFGEARHHLSKLYIDYYCVWIQTISTQLLWDIAHQLKQVQISKQDIGFNLIEIEREIKVNIVEE